MKIKYLLVLLFLFCLSCRDKKMPDEKFDKTRWATKIDEEYPYRNSMLNDLMMHHELHGVKRDSILDMLGAPTRSDTFYLFYRIAQEHLGSLPIHTKTLVIKFKSDSTVEWRKIHE